MNPTPDTLTTTASRMPRAAVRRATTTGLVSATLGLAATLGVAHPAAAEFDVPPLLNPACSPYTTDGFIFSVLPWVPGKSELRVGYSDGVDTCEAEVDLVVYQLPNSEANFNHPDSAVVFLKGHPLSQTEDHTKEYGPAVWFMFENDTCYEFHLKVDGAVKMTNKAVDGCTPDLPEIVLPDPVDPEPGHPGDLTLPDPVDPEPDHPGELTQPEPTGNPDPDGSDQSSGSRLPTTGAATPTLLGLATALLALGGVGRRPEGR